MTIPSSRDRITVDQLDQYLRETATPEVRARVEAWTVAYPEAQVFVARMREAPRADDLDAAWASVVQRIVDAPMDAELAGNTGVDSGGVRTREGVGRAVQWQRLRGTIRRALLPAAIGAAVAILGVVVARKMGTLQFGDRAGAVATYVTGNGERANITLTDGSTVTLGVASRLEVPANYGAGNHTLRLKGEALFTVAHHAGAPFTVLAGGEAARVLGTSFMVRHYATDATTIVAVRDGKVVVHKVVLTADREATIGANGIARLQVTDPAEFSFASGVLTLNGEPLSEAIVELGRWYDADIRLGDASLANKHVKGEFAVGSLADLSSILEMTFDVRVVRDGRVLTLFPAR